MEADGSRLKQLMPDVLGDPRTRNFADHMQYMHACSVYMYVCTCMTLTLCEVCLFALVDAVPIGIETLDDAIIVPHGGGHHHLLCFSVHLQ